jgi:tungstate transport system permease protein
MNIYADAVHEAIKLLAGGNATVWPVILLSLSVSGSAVLIATVVGVPLGYMLGMSRFAGRGFVMALVNTGMGFPPVVVGLFVYMALSRSGPFGYLHLLFTPPGMVVAQVILAVPLVLGVTAAAIAAVPRDMRLQLRALGASRLQEGIAVLREARGGVMISIVAGFGAIISEVGAVTIVGGGIEGYTNVMTTAITADVGRGAFSRAMAWAMILIGIVLVVNIVLTTVQNTGVRYEV